MKTQSITNHLACSILTLVLLTVPVLSNAQAAGSAEAAIDVALERNGGEGKVLGVRDKESENGKPYFQVKILYKGKVRIYKVEKK